MYQGPFKTRQPGVKALCGEASYESRRLINQPRQKAGSWVSDPPANNIIPRLRGIVKRFFEFFSKKAEFFSLHGLSPASGLSGG
jgi:hypothetical protein